MKPSLDAIKIGDNKQIRIGEVTEMFSIGSHTLRYWEDSFEELSPTRVNTQRFYNQHDLEIIWCIKFLLYEKKFTLSGASDMLHYIIAKKIPVDELQQNFDTLFQSSQPTENQDDSQKSEEIKALQKELEEKERMNEQLQKQCDSMERSLSDLDVELSDLQSKHCKASVDIVNLRSDNKKLLNEIKDLQELSGSIDREDLLELTMELRKELESYVNWIRNY